MLTKKEEIILEQVIIYKELYMNCPWWKVMKKIRLYNKWQSLLETFLNINT